MLRDPPEHHSVGDLLLFGVINLDRPPGPSAYQATGRVRDMVDVDCTAHSGTFGPKVTGCLPTLLSGATRIA